VIARASFSCAFSACVVAASLVARLGSPTAAQPENTVRIVTPALFAPLLRQIAGAYGAAGADTTVVVREGSYADDLRDLEAGSAEIAVLDRAPAGTNYIDHPLAVVPYAVILDPNVGVASLTSAQVGGLFAGRITNWSAVGGIDAPVIAVERPANSGTTALFASFFGSSALGGIVVDNTSTAVVDAVRAQRGGVGFVGIPYAKVGGVRILSIDGAQPTADAIADGTYKVYTTIHAVTPGQPPPRVSRFLSFAESRRDLLHAAGFLTIFETRRRL